MKTLITYILAAILILIGSLTFLYKHLYLHFPLKPKEQVESYVVEIKVSFSPRYNKSIKANLFLPQTNEDYLVVDENFLSRGFGLTTLTEDSNRQAIWTIRKASGVQTLYYRAVIKRNIDSLLTSKEQVPEIVLPEVTEAELNAINTIISVIQQKSADPNTFVTNLIANLNRTDDENIAFLLGRKPDEFKKIQIAKIILNYAKFPARFQNGIILERIGKKISIIPRLEVYFDKKWFSYDIKTGSLSLPMSYFPLWYGDSNLINVTGAEQPKYEIGVESFKEDAIIGLIESGKVAKPFLLDFSLFSLPIDTQAVYRVLIMIPVGAFVIIFFRTIIGIKTFGTFMPVLIGLAFRETQLINGIVFFIILIGAGLLVRFFLDKLNLLIVPRLASILTVIVLIMIFVSIISHKLGFESGLSVALFPMVILSMTIERMSVVWDELGAWQAFKQSISTIFCAAIAFFVMVNPLLEHIVFVFPEVLLIILAFNLILGRYMGYRLLELGRFRSLVKEI